MSQPSALQRAWHQANAIGIRAAIACFVKRRLYHRDESIYTVHPKSAHFPLLVRSRSADVHVFYQVFVQREYDCLRDIPHADLIIDCGANVGYSSAFFLSRFPNSRLIAVEPDPGNFALLERNLAPYGTRAEAVHAGVWSGAGGLVVVGGYRDGLEWSRQVRLARSEEKPDCSAVHIAGLLASSGCERISILKMDVEGAEAVIFAENYEHWLDKVDAILIELHDDSSFGRGSEVFFSAIQGRGFEVSYRGDVTVCRRPKDV